MFSFLHLLYTADFKADGWILITMKTEDINFCLDITATPKKTYFLGFIVCGPFSQCTDQKKKKKKEEKIHKMSDESETLSGASHSQGICLIP